MTLNIKVDKKIEILWTAYQRLPTHLLLSMKFLSDPYTYIQRYDSFLFKKGDLEDVHREKETKCVFLTVHDVGTNHSVWENLIGHETFECIKKRAVFIHVDIPGQEDNAEDLGKSS